MAERRTCTECGQEITVRGDGLLRVHSTKATGKSDVCPGGAQRNPKTIDAKATRYLSEGRVKVVHLEPGNCEVWVYGSKPEPYHVHLVGDVWSCPCEAMLSRCSHIVAAARVVPIEMAVPGFGSTPQEDLDALLSVPVPEVEDWSEYEP